MGGVIKCCIPCKPPKRNPGCHDRCPEYIGEKAENDAKKAVADRQKSISNGIYEQKVSGINRANRKRKVKK